MVRGDERHDLSIVKSLNSNGIVIVLWCLDTALPGEYSDNDTVPIHSLHTAV